jgi:hypothetical protein
MSPWTRTAALVLATAAATLPAQAGPAPKPDAKKPAPAASGAEVVDVVGDVTAKRPGQKEFTDVRKGDRLPEKTEISTGLNSECRLKLPTAVIRLEALTTTSIDRLQVRAAAREGGDKDGRVDTKLRLKFGTVKFKVRKGALKTDMKISTPNSTTAISGTEGGVSAYADQPDLSGVTEGGTTMESDEEDYGIDPGEMLDSNGLTWLDRLRRWIFRRIYWILGGTDGEAEGGLNTSGGGTFNPPMHSNFGYDAAPFMQDRASFEGQPFKLPQPPGPPGPPP